MGSMDTPNNNPANSPSIDGPLPEMDSVAGHSQDEQHATESMGASAKPALSLQVICELTRRLAYVSEAREAKIRELRDMIKNDTYHVTAEQIADKMLRS